MDIVAGQASWIRGWIFFRAELWCPYYQAYGTTKLGLNLSSLRSDISNWLSWSTTTSANVELSIDYFIIRLFGFFKSLDILSGFLPIISVGFTEDDNFWDYCCLFCALDIFGTVTMIHTSSLSYVISIIILARYKEFHLASLTTHRFKKVRYPFSNFRKDTQEVFIKSSVQEICSLFFLFMLRLAILLKNATPYSVLWID